MRGPKLFLSLGWLVMPVYGTKLPAGAVRLESGDGRTRSRSEGRARQGQPRRELPVVLREEAVVHGGYGEERAAEALEEVCVAGKGSDRGGSGGCGSRAQLLLQVLATVRLVQRGR